MSDVSLSSGVAETDVQRERRSVLEARMIAKAQESVAAGRLIDSADIDTWIDSLGTDHKLPPPRYRD